MSSHGASSKATLGGKVADASGERVGLCYQCGKCAGGCPVVTDVDVSPSQVIRLVQLDRDEEALSNDMVWSCLGCGTCGGRCPAGLDPARIIDALRAIALQKGIPPPGDTGRVLTFYRAFLDSVREYGRLSEIALMGSYNINSGRLWTNVEKAPWFLLRNKIGLTPHAIRKRDRLERVFQRIEELES